MAGHLHFLLRRALPPAGGPLVQRVGMLRRERNEPTEGEHLSEKQGIIVCVRAKTDGVHADHRGKEARDRWRQGLWYIGVRLS